jgi:hypothetical protein
MHPQTGAAAIIRSLMSAYVKAMEQNASMALEDIMQQP